MLKTDRETLFHQAISDPTRVYKSPEEVALDTRLSREEKIKILDNWALDQKRLLSSQAEHMGDEAITGSTANMLQDISKIRDALAMQS